MMDNLSVVITGGASGLGKEIALMAIARGARAIGIIDVNEEAAKAVVAELSEKVAKVHFVKADIRTAPACQAAFAEMVDALDGVDTLVNSAAIFPRKPMLEITDEDWDLENAINIKGTYHMSVAAIQHMRSRSGQVSEDNPVAGRIVNITSVDAFKAHPQNAHYAATKAAVVSLTKSFAHEVAADQILVNSVAPAGMATDRAKELGFLPELAAASPLNRGAKPGEIAEWVVMAGGTGNSYMTGENIIVSGGYIYA